jgi:D-glycero-D-manno-heptose 1,7-bisphosphate phosphatase
MKALTEASRAGPSGHVLAPPNIAVFLDRDGVLIEEAHIYNAYLTRPDQVRLLPRAAEAVRKLNDAGLRVVVVTNQAALARGIITREELYSIHARMSELLEEKAGAHLDKIYCCPYHPEGVIARYARHSDSRKPGPGMLLQAARDLNLRLPLCFLVGDQESDMIAAKRVHCKAIVVQTDPFGTKWRSWTEGKPDFVAADLAAGVVWILDSLPRQDPNGGP